MSIYTDRKDFFKEMAMSHYLVQHDAAIPDTTINRKSFIVIDNPDELPAAVINQMHFPAVVHFDFSGKPVDKNGSIRIRNNNELLFLDKPLKTDVIITEDKARDAAFNRSFSVMMDFIAFMNNEFEDHGSCGPFKDFDLNLCAWQKQDDLLDGLVGWKLLFSDEVNATSILEFDENKWI